MPLAKIHTPRICSRCSSFERGENSLSESEKFGTVDIESNAIHSNYDTKKYKTLLTNDVIWSPSSFITKSGFVNTLTGMVRNTNYETKKTGEFKDDNTVNELHGVLSHKTSLPMKKDGTNYSKLFSPNFMVRYAPGHMRSLKSKDWNNRWLYGCAAFSLCRRWEC